jgi:hypothetical protein
MINDTMPLLVGNVSEVGHRLNLAELGLDDFVHPNAKSEAEALVSVCTLGGISNDNEDIPDILVGQ